MSTLYPADASAQPETTADRSLERWIVRAERLRARGRSGAAISVLRRAADRAPADPRPVLGLSELLLPEEPADAAAVEPSLRLRADAAELVRRLGDVQIAGDPRDARYRELTGRLRALVPWAVALTGDHRSAIERASLAAGRLDDVAARTLRRLGALAVRRHDLIAADRAVTAAGRADPVDVALITDLAAIRLARGRADDAVRLLLEAARRRPENTRIERDLAGALLAAGRPSEGLARFAAIAAAHPEEARSQLDLARAALEAGLVERATQAARAARAHADASDPEPLLVLAAARIAAGDETGARAAFREALRRVPGNRRATRGLLALE